MDNIRYFKKKEEYTQFIKGEYIKPNISFVEETGETFYNTGATNEEKQISFDIINGTFKGTTIPNFLKNLPNSLFEGNKNFTEITIPPLVKKIGDKCFAGCTNISKITFNEGLVEIGDIAFKGCKLSNMTELSFPDTVTKIGNIAFGSNDTIKKVTTPKNLQELGYSAFSELNSLETLILNEGLITIGGMLTNTKQKIKNLTIPSTVEKIDGDLNSCETLKWVKFLGTTPPTISSTTFEFDYNHGLRCEIFVPDDSVNEYKQKFDKLNYRTVSHKIKPLSEFKESDFQ